MTALPPRLPPTVRWKSAGFVSVHEILQVQTCLIALHHLSLSTYECMFVVCGRDESWCTPVNGALPDQKRCKSCHSPLDLHMKGVPAVSLLHDLSLAQERQISLQTEFWSHPRPCSPPSIVLGLSRLDHRSPDHPPHG